MDSNLLTGLILVESAGDIPRPVIRDRGAATKDGHEIGQQLQRVVARPAALRGPVQREVLEQHRAGGREHVPGRGDDAPPLTGGEKERVEHQPVQQPQHVESQMPPAGEAYRVAEAGETDVLGEADGVVFGRPQGVWGDRLLDPEPLPSRGRVPRPVEARVVGQDLQPGPDDEDHEECIQEC